MVPGISVELLEAPGRCLPLLLLLSPEVHNSGVSRILCTTDWKASDTPIEVFAEASMKSEFIRTAKCCPSEYVT